MGWVGWREGKGGAARAREGRKSLNSLKSPGWVEWRGREREREGRRGFSPRVGLKTTTTTRRRQKLPGAGDHVAVTRGCTEVHATVLAIQPGMDCVSPETPEAKRGESFAFLFFFQAVHLLLLPFSPSFFSTRNAMCPWGRDHLACQPPHSLPFSSSSCGQLRSLSSSSGGFFLLRKGVYEGNN